MRAGTFVAGALAVAASVATLAACASRMRVDESRIKTIEKIAPVSFVGTKYVRPPAGGDSFFSDENMATASMIFDQGVPVFFEALRRTERFELVPVDTILGAKAYSSFPSLVGTNAVAAELANGWRYVTPDDGEKIAALLAEIDADAALITYWRFTLDSNTRGVGVDTANPRTHVRAWLVDREGKIIADDEIDVHSQEIIGIINGIYDSRELPALFTDPIETIAVRLVVDLSNARSKARGK